jgi:hypothetical protein
MLQRYWFGDVDEEGCRTAGTDPAALAERAATLRTGMDSFVPIDWEVARDCGVVRTREEYVDLLHPCPEEDRAIIPGPGRRAPPDGEDARRAR